MTQVLESDLDAFRSSFTGQVILARDTDYDSARSLWNGCFDRHPTVIARCYSPADVAAAIAFGREQDMEISVRGGWHSFSGVSITDGSLTIDLSQLREVVVDPAARRARCGGGTTGADLDAACQQHGHSNHRRDQPYRCGWSDPRRWIWLADSDHGPEHRQPRRRRGGPGGRALRPSIRG